MKAEIEVLEKMLSYAKENLETIKKDGKSPLGYKNESDYYTALGYANGVIDTLTIAIHVLGEKNAEQ